MRAALVAISIALCSCVPTPDSYSVPPQHKHNTGDEIVSFGDYFRASDPGTDAYVIKDIQKHEGADWRWTFREPEVRLFLQDPAKRRLRVVFEVHDATFRDTGPVPIVFVVNGVEVGKETYGKPGGYAFERVVPDKILKHGAENRVALRILNPWKAPDPGVYLGVLLRQVGFVP